MNGRGEWIRTTGLLVPNQALYQAEPRPEAENQYTIADTDFRYFRRPRLASSTSRPYTGIQLHLRMHKILLAIFATLCAIGEASAQTSPKLRFVPVSPCRIKDTRIPDLIITPLAAVEGGTSRDFPIAGFCGVPSTAKAFSLNITAIPVRQPKEHHLPTAACRPRENFVCTSSSSKLQ